MKTKKKQSDFTTDVLSSLLSFSMQNPVEAYLSKEIKDVEAAENTGLKGVISRAIGIKFFGNGGKTIDNEIESAVDDAKDPGNMNGMLVDDGFLSKIVAENEEKKPVDEIKSALKNMYHTFVSYAKGTYGKVSEGMGYLKKKIVEGPVRMTLSKFVKVSEYILATLNPQWNMPTLSKMDFDTLAPAVTGHIVINEEDSQSGYGH
jgi:hypothetical protein